MKIISKYQDYYFYLSHIYGIDEKIVLDTRKYNVVKFLPNDEKKITLYLCDWVFEGYYKDSQFYWGIDCLNLLSKEDKEKFNPAKQDRISISSSKSYNYRDNRYIHINPYRDPNLSNTKENCPIMLNTTRYGNELYDKYPILQDIKFNTVLEPQQIYLLLTEWLSPKENHVDTRTDNEKVTSNGFDLKTSFRKM